MFPCFNIGSHLFEVLNLEKFEYIEHLIRNLTHNSSIDISIADRILFLYISSLRNQNNMIDNNLYIDKFIQRLNKPEYLDMSIEELCADFPYSHSMLLQYFKKHTNMTIVEYRSMIKLKMACQMLQETDLKIIDIAASLHYNSLSHFLRVFKSAYNMTPSQYRQKYK